QAVFVSIKPEAVVENEAQKAFFLMPLPSFDASDSPPGLPSDIPRQRECSLAHKTFLIVVVLVLDAFVAVITHAARHAERPLPERILIAKQREPSVRPPQDLQTKARPSVEPAIRLPAIGEPRLNLQMLRGEDLHTHSVEEPRGVRRNVRRLVGPIVEVVVTEKPDIGHEDSRIDIDPMQGIEVVTAVRLGKLTVRVVPVTLPSRRDGIISWRRLGIHPKLRHQARTDIVIVKVAPDPELRHVHFPMAKHFARTADRVVLRMVEAIVVVHIGADF